MPAAEDFPQKILSGHLGAEMASAACCRCRLLSRVLARHRHLGHASPANGGAVGKYTPAEQLSRSDCAGLLQLQTVCAAGCWLKTGSAPFWDSATLLGAWLGANGCMCRPRTCTQRATHACGNLFAG
eukprot:COSAG01_NODE_3162_length_6478_cov_6.251450_7_plen_127_part_00